jgi:ribosomal protein L40E
VGLNYLLILHSVTNAVLNKSDSNSMIPKTTFVTALVLAVAVFAFAILSVEIVTIGTTQTITETGVSYSPYVETDVETYTSTSQSMFSYLVTSLVPAYECSPFCGYYSVAYTYGYVNSTQTFQSSYTGHSVSTITYSQTLTESSTSDVPASEELGLSGSTFMGLAIAVIVLLAIVTAWSAFKPVTRNRPKQTTLSRYVKLPASCVKCGVELPPASEYCNKCGTKQP